MTDSAVKNGDGQPKKKWGKGQTDPASWWEKGAPSPNPKGRPKGSKNQKTIYKEAFGVKVAVDIDGKDQVMTKKELGYHQVAQKSAAGDLKAFQIQLALDEKYDPVEAAPPTPEESKADYQTYQAWFELREKFKVFEKETEADAPSVTNVNDPNGKDSSGLSDQKGDDNG